jgi:hypothetical protein
LREVFLWGTLVSPLPSSRLAAKLGPVRIFGIGILGAGVLAVVVPFGTWFSSYHINIRFVQGLFTVSTFLSITTKQMSFRTVHQFIPVVCINNNNKKNNNVVTSLKNERKNKFINKTFSVISLQYKEHFKEVKVKVM